MSTIEPGTPVTVTLPATMEQELPHERRVRLQSGHKLWLSPDDPAVQVVPLDPERPSLAQLLGEHHIRIEHGEQCCACSWSPTTGDSEVGNHLAEQLRAAGLAL